MPLISRILDFATIPTTRGFFSQISTTVYRNTGFRFHPATFQMMVALAVAMIAYFVYIRATNTGRGLSA